jgi:hypothetical protein
MPISVTKKIELTTKAFECLHDMVTDYVPHSGSTKKFVETHNALMLEVLDNLNGFYSSKSNEKV